MSCCKNQEDIPKDHGDTSDDECHCTNPFCCIKQAPLYLIWELGTAKNLILDFNNNANSGNAFFTNRQFSEIWHPPI